MVNFHHQQTPQANLLLVLKQDIRDLGWLIRSCYNVLTFHLIRGAYSFTYLGRLRDRTVI
jgi:hypothetical protein